MATPLTAENLIPTLGAAGFDTSEKLIAALGLLGALTVTTVARQDFEAAQVQKQADLDVANGRIEAAQQQLVAAQENERRASEAVGDIFRPKAGESLVNPFSLDAALESMSKIGR